DAMSGVSGDGAGEYTGRVEIVLDEENGALYCANAGRPFSQKGLIAITHAHLSGKRGDEIGRFGLGFKSVLAVTDRPQVFSRSLSFEFNSAQSREELAKVGSSAKRYPALLTPTLVEPASEFAADPVLSD